MPQDPSASDPTVDHPVLDVTIERFVAGGKGLGHAPDGRVVLVDGGLPGDRLMVEVTRDRPNLLTGTIGAVLEAAPARIEPPCPEVDKGCGGCDLQHVESSRQPELKAEVVRDAIRRTAKLDDVEVVLGPELVPFGYRTTLRCVVDPTTGRLGFRRRRSHDPHVVDDCMIAHPRAAEVIREARFPGEREVLVRVSVATGERMVVVPGRSGASADFRVPDDVSVVSGTVGGRARGRRRGGTGRPSRSSGARSTGTRSAGEQMVEERFIHEVVAGRRFRISAGSFFQARPDGAAALVDAVRRMLPDFDGNRHRLVDLYGGVGLFSACLEAREGELVEVSRSATGDASVNLQDLGTTVRTLDVADWRPSVADVVVADPSRAGLGKDGVAAVIGTRAPEVVLVSCDPAAMARDMGMLVEAGYSPTRVEVVDMFPQTRHVETVTGFRRR